MSDRRKQTTRPSTLQAELDSLKADIKASTKSSNQQQLKRFKQMYSRNRYGGGNWVLGRILLSI